MEYVVGHDKHADGASRVEEGANAVRRRLCNRFRLDCVEGSVEDHRYPGQLEEGLD
jgi:hypothetical protein